DHLAALGVHHRLRVVGLLVAVMVALAHQSTLGIGQVDLLGVLGHRRRRISTPRRSSTPTLALSGSSLVLVRISCALLKCPSRFTHLLQKPLAARDLLR